MSVILLTGVIGYSTFVYWYMNNQYNKSLDSAKTVGLVLAQDFAKLVLLNNVSAAADISSSLKSFSNLDALVLYTLDGKPVLQYSIDNVSFKPKPLPNKSERKSIINGNKFKLYVDAKYQGTHLGYMYFNLHIDTISDVIKKNINALILIIGFMFILSYLLTMYFAKKFTDPILNLVSFLEKIDLVDGLKNRIKTEEQNEYGKLFSEVNTMLDRLESSHNVLKLAAVAFETQNGITITDKNQKILQVNSAFTDITGYSAEEVIGKTPKILQSGLHDAEFYEQMRFFLKENNFWIGEINNKHKDGSIVNEHLTIHVVLDDDGEVLYYVGSFLDMTSQKNTEKKLKEKENLLVQQSKMAAMGEMIENIAHQWKQPLSIISAASTSIMLKKDLKLPFEKDEEIKQLTVVNDTVQYLSHTIDDFREFFRPDKAKRVFNLKNCYKKALNLVESKLKSLSIEFIDNLDDITISSLENELIQVLINLLNNAKDVLEDKKSQRRLIFTDIYVENKNAILTIKDNGGGIPENIIENIFEPYFTTKELNGTGIGLNMSKEIITGHLNGKISVKNSTYIYEDVQYTGAIFKISIPLEN
ncbi:PAS domain S-box protein [Arcobacter sp. LA11]|uniref:sensor histidine kinase n=1 Tax=Arcobacter sp. LA11 TaxID=1898176 RepID=UPI0011601AA1|nr:PAS domain S-box protein [Arcobacter sp. LA11]